jgi:hypothetical protein
VVDFACLFERFDPAVPLEAGDPAYVDWQAEVGLTDVKRQLVNGVVLMRDSYTHRLFTGLRGGGKTTELRKLQRYLQEKPDGQRYFVSFLDADDSLDLDDADPTDLVLSLVRQLVDDLREQGIPVSAGSRLKGFLESTREMLSAVPDAGIDLKLSDPGGLVELSTALKRQPSVRRQVRQLLEGRLENLYDAINHEFLPAVKVELEKRGFAGIVVIVDQLDRIPPDEDRHRMVFWEGRGKLKALDCHVIYTAPIEYAYSRALPGLETEYGEVLGLPLIPVTARDAEVRAQALRVTKEVALERLAACGVEVQQLFEEPSLLDELIHLSGGHLRSLFLLVRTAIETSGLEAPLRRDHMEQVAERLAAKYLDPLELGEREVLVEVHRSKGRPVNELELERFYDLLRDQYVFAYSTGGERWYDWNPLLARSSLHASCPTCG